MNAVVMLSRRNLASNRLRVGLTSLAVMIGVAFVVASFVLADGLRATFDAIVEDVNADVDATVRAESDFDEVVFQQQTFDEAILDLVRGVEGVGEALPALTSSKVVPIDVKPETWFQWFTPAGPPDEYIGTTSVVALLPSQVRTSADLRDPANRGIHTTP